MSPVKRFGPYGSKSAEGLDHDVMHRIQQLLELGVAAAFVQIDSQ